MVNLRLNAGRIRNPDIHKIGIIALGSHLENHGPALPIDTDAKIASYIALKASLNCGAKFLGIIYPAHELDEINHGVHVSLEELKDNIVENLNSAKKYLGIEKVIIVNAHGGNLPIFTKLHEIEDKTGLVVILNSKVIDCEGPHGGTGELSMAKIIGILDEKEVKNQANIEKFEEIGLYGFHKARENNPNIEEGARDIEENGVEVDEIYGRQLLNLVINDIVLDCEKLLDF